MVNLLASWYTSMTSHTICDVTTVFLKYGKYIEKLKLTAQARFISFICVNRMIEGFYYVIWRISKVLLSCFGALYQFCLKVWPQIIIIWNYDNMLSLSWVISSATGSQFLIHYTSFKLNGNQQVCLNGDNKRVIYMMEHMMMKASEEGKCIQ